ncbi:hypothetical protein [Lacticaseibacillus sp. GG6-2]
MTHNLRSRQGTTLIETLVALGLLVLLIGLGTPLLRLAAQSRWQDGEFQAVAAFDESLQTSAEETTILQLTTDILKFTNGETVQWLVFYQKSDADPGMLRMIDIDQNGHMPMLIGVQAIRWQQHDRTISYLLTMASGRRYEGVVVSKWNQKRQRTDVCTGDLRYDHAHQCAGIPNYGSVAYRVSADHQT